MSKMLMAYRDYATLNAQGAPFQELKQRGAQRVSLHQKALRDKIRKLDEIGIEALVCELLIYSREKNSPHVLKHHFLNNHLEQCFAGFWTGHGVDQWDFVFHEELASIVKQVEAKARILLEAELREELEKKQQEKEKEQKERTVPVHLFKRPDSTVDYPIKGNAKSIDLSAKVQIYLTRRREELFRYYRDRCGFHEIWNVSDNTREKVSIEKYKMDRLIRFGRVGREALPRILPRQIVTIGHAKPLTILAFSDYRIHDIESLIRYLEKVKKKPDIILYAGDDVSRFGPVPLEYLSACAAEDSESLIIPSLHYDNRFVVSPAYGFVLRLSKLLDHQDEAGKKLLLIWNTVHSFYEDHKAKSIESVESLSRILASGLEVKIGEIGRHKERKVSIVESSSGTEICRIRMDDAGKLDQERESSYHAFYAMYTGKKLAKLRYLKLGVDDNYVYYYVPSPDQPSYNVFEKLSQYAEYGLAAILGNDDDRVTRVWIHGKKVYELHTSLLKIGPFLIVGLEGSPCGLGQSGEYLETDVKLRLEFAKRKLEDKDLMVVVSHAPPRGILDRALRWGERPIGSIALKDFLEEEDKVRLILCGHVHSCGGKYEKLNETTVVNVSSHDDCYSRANLAWITIEPDGNVSTEMVQLPSKLEQMFSEKDSDIMSRLANECWLSRQESELFIDSARKYGQRFFDCLTEMTTVKLRYGLPWKLVIALLKHEITKTDQISDEIFERLSHDVTGIYRVHLNKAWIKFKREKAEDAIYLIRELPLTSDRQVVAFDTEYNQTMGALYGFLDLTDGTVSQYWFDEKEKAAEYIAEKEKKDCIFIHWGGNDKRIVEGELGRTPPTFNLLYFCQTSLVAPMTSTMLKDVHDALCGHSEDKWWKSFFYGIDGLQKLGLCNRIFANPTETSLRKTLAEANKSDLVALHKTLKRLKQIPVRHSLNQPTEVG